MKKKAFTVIELLIVIAVLVMSAAITFPVFSKAKFAANKTHCGQQLKQVGIAILVYREDHMNAELGTPRQMGMPLHHFSGLKFPCRGNSPEHRGLFMEWPDPAQEDESPEAQLWARYVGFNRGASVMAHDPNHQDAFPRSSQWELWTSIGLKIDGGTVVRTRLGFPHSYSWWHK